MERTAYIESVLNKMKDLFGDDKIADIEVHPRMARYQFLLAKFHIDNNIP